MKISALIFLLLISVSSIGAVDKPTAPPFTGRNTQYQRIPRQQKKQLERKKYPLWVKVAAGVAIVTTTAIIGGLIWNHCHGFEFDGPYTYLLATCMNIGIVLNKVGVSDQFFKKCTAGSHSILLTAMGASIFCLEKHTNKKRFYNTFKHCFYTALVMRNGHRPTAN